MRPDQQPSSRVEFEVELPPTSTGEPGAVLKGKGHLIRREDLGDQITGVAAAIDRYEFITTTNGTAGNHKATKPAAAPHVPQSPPAQKKSANVIAMARR
jgi:hypothetical protein